MQTVKPIAKTVRPFKPNFILLNAQSPLNDVGNCLLVFSVMKYIKEKNRTQITLIPVSFDDAVDAEKEVRLIDVFVCSLKPKGFSFIMTAYNLR